MARIGGRRWTLRTRLVAALLALTATVGVIIGVGTGLALRTYLFDQLDSQVVGAANRFAAAQQNPGGDPDHDHPRLPAGGTFLNAPGQQVGTLGAQLTGGRVTADGVYDSNGKVQVLTAAEAAALATLPVDGQPHSRDLGELGSYRLRADSQPDGGVLVTGLPISGVNAVLGRLATVEAVVIGVALVLAGLLATAIVRLSLRPLRRVASTASRVSELPLDSGEVALLERVPAADSDPRTEVGQVGAALNRLLGHVAGALAARQASETRVRRFVADASHELRTPLASIRGYAELTRRGGAGVPPDTAHALARIESEAKRMTTLVEDLLLLARLDSGRPLAHRPVDLSRLVVDVVSDASVVSPDRRWQLELPDEPVVVAGDADRLHQVLANLLANARTHTPPGTTVVVSLAVLGAEVRLGVLDDGPGIPADLQPRIFERFARGDDSRSRTAGSTGLGLAIVAAVAEAHGGTVEVDSRPGRTAFIVHLPAEPPLTAAVPAAERIAVR